MANPKPSKSAYKENQMASIKSSKSAYLSNPLLSSVAQARG